MTAKKLFACENCGQNFTQWPSQMGRRAFCCRACYWKSKEGVEPHNKGKKTIVSKACAGCGKEISGAPSEVKRRKYCSSSCAGRSFEVPLAKILERYIVNKETDCWIWTGYKNGGYGRFKTASGGSVYAHRASYEFHVGPVPEGLYLDHLCRNRACINPDHLEPVTTEENIRRGEQGSEDAMKKHWETRRNGGDK